MKKNLPVYLLIVVSLLSTTFIKAATYTWTGAINTNWNLASNWGGAGFPVAGDIANIPNTANKPTVNVTAACATLNFTGATTLTMSSSLTVSGAINIGAAVTITGASTLSGATLNFTSSSASTIGANVSISGLTTINNTFTPNVSISSGKTLTLTGGLTIGSTSTSSFTISGTGTVAVSGTTTMNQNTTLTNGGTSTLTFTAGSTLSMTNTTSLVNSGTVNFSGTSGSGCILSFGGNPETITNSGTLTATYLTTSGAGTIISFSNSGTFNVSNSTFSLNFNSSFTNTGGTSTFTSSTVNLPNGISYFSSTAGTITLNACTVTVSGGAPCYLATSSSGSFVINNASNVTLSSTNSPYLSSAGTGSFTINGGSIITLTGGSQQIKNSGTMYAGTSNSACTINLNNQPSNTTTGANIYNTGSFYLGSTSVIKFTSGVYQETINNSGTTFTLQSDSYGTGQIGTLYPANSQSTIGIFTVQRYFTGGALSNRGYRLMSSPVNNTNNTVPTPITNTYNFTTSPSLHDAMIITGPGGPSNSFDPPAGWGVPYSPTSVTILNYSTASQTFSSPASLAAATPKIGTGFYFFFRGNNTTNRATKLVKSGTYAVPEAVVAGQTGYLNQGDFTVGLNYISGNGFTCLGNPYAATIDLTLLDAGNVYYDAWMYDRTNNSCQAYDYYAGYSADPNITKYVASGEGFFVKAMNTSGYVTFQEDAKITAGAYQQTGSKLLMGIPKQFADGRIRLKLQQDSSNADFAMLLFNDSYTAKYNADEDVDDMNAAAQTVLLSSLTADDLPVAINKLPLDKQKTSSFLSVSAAASGPFTFSKVDIANISTAYNVWLIDHFTKDSINLRTTANYSFNIDLSIAATFGNSRFEIVICKQNLPVYKLVTFAGKRTNNANVLNWTTLNEYAYTTFEVQSSVDGKKFFSIATIQSDSSAKYTYTDKSAKTGIFYRLKQSDINDVVTFSNIIFIDFTLNSFSLYPNPATNAIQFKVNQEVRTSLSLRVFSSTGTQVKLSTFTQNSGTQDVSLLSPGIYTILLFDNSTRQTVASGKFVKI